MSKVVVDTDISNLKEEIIKIEGMSCEMCTWLVLEALMQAEGVNSAEVDLEGKQADVIYDPGLTNLNSIKRAIESAGSGFYKAVGD